MKFIAFSFILSSFLIFCNSKKQKDVSGIYESPQNNSINKLKYGHFVLDLKLILKKDSTYTFSTCSQVTKGKWSYKKNTIILECNQRKMIIDSLNDNPKYKKGKICGSDEIYSFSNEILKRSEKIKGKKEIHFIMLKN